jgi:hypothetical protein
MSVEYSASPDDNLENFLRSSKYRYVPSRHRGSQKKTAPIEYRSHLSPVPRSLVASNRRDTAS